MNTYISKIISRLITVTILLCNALIAQNDIKQCFINAKFEMDSMLSGKKPLDYERAVFITENAYHNNYFSYTDFQKKLDNHQLFVEFF